MEKGSAYALSRIGGSALLAVETPETGLTGDYLRARLSALDLAPGSLVRGQLTGQADNLRVRQGATGRAALPVLTATAD